MGMDSVFAGPALPCLVCRYALVVGLCMACVAAIDFQCQTISDTYFARHHREPSPYTGDNMVYFLHVPRTAGRTFHDCFLRAGMDPSRVCPNAWDHLRIDTAAPNCSLLSSHDDFSIVSMLPEGVSVLTHIRDPVDRFLSAYEFAVEVASRTFKPHKELPANEPKRVMTEDVWPWHFLVPFFVQDMNERLEKLKQQPHSSEGNWIQYEDHESGETFYFNMEKGQSKWKLSEEEQALLLQPLDPYDNPLVMSLAEFARHPVAAEFLHNGQSFQVLGITNYSHWSDAAEMRQCIWQDETAMTHMLDVALTRLSKFMHLGTTNRLAESVAAAGVAMGYAVSGDAHAVKREQHPHEPDLPADTAGGEVVVEMSKSVQQAQQSLQNLKREVLKLHQSSIKGPETEQLKEKFKEARRMLIDKQVSLSTARAGMSTAETPAQQANAPPAITLGDKFRRCAHGANHGNEQRRSQSFTHVYMPFDGRGVEFTHAARSKIPPSVIEEIRLHNRMDQALYQRADEMLSQHRAAWAAEGKLQELSDAPLLHVPETPKRAHMAYDVPRPADPEEGAEL